MLKSVKPSKSCVISPLLPNIKIIEMEIANGGDIKGRIAIKLNNFFPLILIYAAAYAKIKPMIVAITPTIVANNKVFVIEEKLEEDVNALKYADNVTSPSAPKTL